MIIFIIDVNVTNIEFIVSPHIDCYLPKTSANSKAKEPSKSSKFAKLTDPISPLHVPIQLLPSKVRTSYLRIYFIKFQNWRLDSLYQSWKWALLTTTPRAGIDTMSARLQLTSKLGFSNILSLTASRFIYEHIQIIMIYKLKIMKFFIALEFNFIHKT